MNYKKYRWMLTCSGKVVFGGKSAEQNEEVVKWLGEEVAEGRDYLVMHTSTPGSPFAVLFAESYTELDVRECAIFCGCFSRAWRERRKKVKVDSFYASSVFKDGGMKQGTFGVKKKDGSRNVVLELYLEVQDGKIRAVPHRRVGTDSLIVLRPGKMEKEKAAEVIAKKLGFKKEEVIEALPTGGFLLCKLK